MDRVSKVLKTRMSGWVCRRRASTRSAWQHIIIYKRSN